MSASELVLILFSEKDRDEKFWTSIRTAIIEQINHELGNTEVPKTIQTRFSDSAPDSSSGSVLEITFQIPSANSLTLRDCKSLTNKPWFSDFENTHQIQIVLRPTSLNVLKTQPGLAVFDMDSTLIQQEVIDELARAVGLYDQVAAITEAAMRGEEPYTDFTASLRARVALLKGVPVGIWEELKKDVITFTPGAIELLRILKRLGWKTAVLSGGFMDLATWVQATLGMDYAFANRLVADDATQQLTGELVPGAMIVNGDKKRELVLQLAEENGIGLDRVMAVGDGSNDLPMMGVAAMGVAFNAKPKVQRLAPCRLGRRSLRDVLFLLGFERGEIEKTLLECPGYGNLA